MESDEYSPNSVEIVDEELDKSPKIEKFERQYIVYERDDVGGKKVNIRGSGGVDRFIIFEVLLEPGNSVDDDPDKVVRVVDRFVADDLYSLGAEVNESSREDDMSLIVEFPGEVGVMPERFVEDVGKLRPVTSSLYKKDFWEGYWDSCRGDG